MSFGCDLGARQAARFGIYVHVPFCAGVCPYCDFVKTGRFTRSDVDAFFSRASESLARALDTVPPGWSRSCTLYFGGGTPGLFPAERLVPLIERVRGRFLVEECTVECNPMASGGTRFAELHAAGVDRVTLGVQSLCPETLRALGRRHSPELALDAVRQARASGIPQVQADLIFGLKPHLRTLSVGDEVRRLAEAGATGISGYALTLEPRTRLWQSGLADEDVAADDYAALASASAAAGFERRETANFSQFEAKHNNIYWHGWPYLGVGTGAHGLDFPSAEHPWGRRYRVGDIPRERAPGDDLLPFAQEGEALFRPVWEDPRNAQQVLAETVYTLLRTARGLPWRWLDELRAAGVRGPEGPLWHGRNFRRDILDDAKVSRGIDEGRLVADDEGLRLSGNEFLLGDGWAAHLLGLLEAGQR